MKNSISANDMTILIFPMMEHKSGIIKSSYFSDSICCITCLKTRYVSCTIRIYFDIYYILCSCCTE